MLAGRGWIAADLLLIPGMVRARNEKLQTEAEMKALASKSDAASEAPSA